MKGYKRFLAVMLAAAIFALCGCAHVAPAPQESPKTGDRTGFAIFTAQRAEQPKDPNSAFSGDPFNEENEEAYYEMGQKWFAARSERQKAAANAPDMEAFTRGLYSKLAEAAAETAGGSNVVCSPVSVYIALGMLAEITGGGTRAEILSALGAKDIASLRRGVAALLAAETVDDGSFTSLIGNSVWLNENLDYREEPLKQLAEVYLASSFSGDPEDEAFVRALRSWLNENTGGLLKDAAEGIDPGSVITLANTIYMKARWDETFPESLTKEAVFHGAEGEARVPFMNNSIMGAEVISGRGFTAAVLGFTSGEGRMLLFLPDEGLTPADIMDGVMSAVFAKAEGERSAMVSISLPKFDVAANTDLIPVLKGMGIKSCFGPAADFEPLLPSGVDAVVSSVSHAARVKVDEEGMEAAAYTVITADGAMFTEKSYELIFDHPFVFVVTGTSGAPLFMGTVNTLG